MFEFVVILCQTLVPLPFEYPVHSLSVSVAERSTHGAHTLAQSHVHGRSVTQVHVVVKRPATNRSQQNRNRITAPLGREITYAFLEGGESRKVIVP